MKTLGLSVERQLRFLAALAASGDARAAAETTEAYLGGATGAPQLGSRIRCSLEER